MTSPNTTCLPSSQSVLSHVRKNWEPLVFGPELAMESRPGGGKEQVSSLHPGSLTRPTLDGQTVRMPVFHLIDSETVSRVVSIIFY